MLAVVVLIALVVIVVGMFIQLKREGRAHAEIEARLDALERQSLDLTLRSRARRSSTAISTQPRTTTLTRSRRMGSVRVSSRGGDPGALQTQTMNELWPDKEDEE